MNEEELKLILLVVGGVVIVISNLLYSRTPRLHTCAGCGRYLDIQAKRQFYCIDEKNHPVCFDCLRDPRTELISYDQRERTVIIEGLSYLLTKSEMELLTVKVKDGRLKVTTKDKLLAEKIASIIGSEVKSNRS